MVNSCLSAALILMMSLPAAAQDDVLTKAREAATSGRRGEAVNMLEAHLQQTPRDVDARLLLGLVLSWDGRYDDARPVLQEVLTQAPTYMDARVALMNVEYWSGRSTEAREQADRILARDPGNATARAVRERLEAAARRWWASTNYSVDSFSDDRDPWQEVAVYLTRRTPVGSVIARVNHATRFSEGDQLIEVELYPRFRPGTYAYIESGVATEASLYPHYRVAFDVYQSLGRGFEVSGGARYLDFDTVTQIYVGTLSKYLGNWMFTGKVYHVPAERDLESTSYYGGFRRYFGGDGTSYVGMNYIHGFSREEVRTVTDLANANSNTARGEFDVVVGPRLRIFGSGGTSRMERPVSGSTLWQTTITSGFSVHF